MHAQVGQEEDVKDIEIRNEVLPVGRLAAPAEDRELPSGDVITSWRLVVDRPPLKRKLPQGMRPPTIDTLDCVAWAGAVQRSAAGWQTGGTC